MTFLDPIAVVKHQEAQDSLPSVYPEEFYKKYRDQADGSKKEEHWVIVAKRGMQNPTRTPMRWKDIERSPEMKQVLEPFYNNWIHGQAAPVVGTALDSWIADANLVKVLNSVNIRSVEEFAQLEDHLLVKLNIPDLRDKQRRARAFLQAQQDTAKVSAEVSVLRGENEGLKSEIAELRSLIEKHAIKQEEAKRPRGRPRKIPEAIQ